MVIMMKMGCFLMNEARIIRSLPSTDGRRGCVGNSAVPLSSAALKQPASPEGGFRLAKRTPDGGLGRTYSRSSLCNDPLHGIDSPWRTRAIGEAQEQGYTHLRATCPKCGRIEYRRRANECIAAAGQVAEPERKVSLLELAQRWLRLAFQVDEIQNRNGFRGDALLDPPDANQRTY